MFDISLIVPTYGRKKELEELLVSLTKQAYDMSKVEIIIVDQNDNIDLSQAIQQFSGKLTILHVRSDVKGIARSKNIGLKMARAEIVSFLDDDCTYYPDTVARAMQEMNSHPDIQVIYGRLYDRESGKNIMRKWSAVPLKLNKLNFHLNYSAISCFTRDKTLLFDERLGVGSKYGVGEELDYIMQLLKRGSSVYFMPQIEIWHPEPSVNAMSAQKTYYYAEGYGATFRKNPLLPFLFIFFSSCAYQLGLSVLELLKGNREMANKRWLAFKGRINGFRIFTDTVAEV